MLHTNPPKLFLCHASSDKPFVEWLADRLKSFGLRIWLDKWEIKVGDSIVVKINEGISSSDYIVVVLSKMAVASDWVKEELSAGIIRNIESQGAFVLPVLIEDCDIPPLLGHRRYADFRQDKDHGLSEILGAIRPRDEEILTGLTELMNRFTTFESEMLSKSSEEPPIKRLAPCILAINNIMEQAVHLRFLREVDTELLKSKGVRWNVFYDELELLRIKGIDLRKQPVWGHLRNFRNHYVHSSPTSREAMSEDLNIIIAGIGTLREILVKLMEFNTD